jgi:uncharacterized membrane protein HdeD (DUF308 family)
MFSDTLSRYWWTTLFRGIVWVLFGVALISMPGISLVTLTFFFGAFALVDGVSTLIGAFGGRRESSHWWLLLLIGLAGIAVGVLTFMNPAITALGLLYYIAVWAIVIGVVQIVAAIQLRKEITGEFWLGLGGLASVLFGIFAIVNPGAGALAVLGLIAIYAIAFGITLILVSFKVRTFGRCVAHALAR